MVFLAAGVVVLSIYYTHGCMFICLSVPFWRILDTFSSLRWRLQIRATLYCSFLFLSYPSLLFVLLSIDLERRLDPSYVQRILAIQYYGLILKLLLHTVDVVAGVWPVYTHVNG